MKNGMSKEQAEALARQVPPSQLRGTDKFAGEDRKAAGGAGPQAGQRGDKVGGDKAAGDKAGADKKGAAAHEERTTLPGEIVSQFKQSGVDLAAVPVIKSSAAAKRKNVKGFATHSEIHVASGVDEMEVMRHEAAHVVQMRRGQKGGQSEGRGANEAKAKSAEHGGGGDPGVADPSQTYHSEHEGEGGGAERQGVGLPQCNFTWNATGLHFEGAKGRLAEVELANLHPANPIRMFHVTNFWPIPALPIAGLSVMAEGEFAPAFKTTLGAEWEYKHEQHKIEVKGEFKNSFQTAIIFRCRAGAAINAVIAEGGVGLEAAATAEAHANTSKSITFGINTQTGEVDLVATPIEFDIGATLKAALSLVAWVDSWFGGSQKRWTFAEFTIATLTGFKMPLNINILPHFNVAPGPLTAGRFDWGAPPQATEHNAH